MLKIGVKSVKRGPIPDDGTMSTMLSSIGDTYKGSVTFKADAAGEFIVEVNEHDDPIYQYLTKGKRKLAFSLPDADPDTRVVVMGGEVLNGVHLEADYVPVIEESYQLITRTGVLIEFPRMSVTGSDNDDLKNDAVGLVDVMCTPLKPKGVSVKSVMTSVYQKPTVSAGDAQPNVTVDHANLVGTATAYRGEITEIVWSVDTAPVGAVPVLATPAALACAVSALTVDGVYKFRLTVTDENDFSNSATVLVTVALA